MGLSLCFFSPEQLSNPLYTLMKSELNAIRGCGAMAACPCFPRMGGCGFKSRWPYAFNLNTKKREAATKRTKNWSHRVFFLLFSGTSLSFWALRGTSASFGFRQPVRTHSFKAPRLMQNGLVSNHLLDIREILSIPRSSQPEPPPPHTNLQPKVNVAPPCGFQTEPALLETFGA